MMQSMNILNDSSCSPFQSNFSGALVEKYVNRMSDLNEVDGEMSVDVTYSQEGQQLCLSCWWIGVAELLGVGLIYLTLSWIDHMPKVLRFSLRDDALIDLQNYAGLRDKR